MAEMLCTLMTLPETNFTVTHDIVFNLIFQNVIMLLSDSKIMNFET